MSKKKITDPEGSMEELIARAVAAAKAPFTTERKSDLPSLRSVAEELGTTVSSGVAFAMLYAMNQLYRKLWPEKGNVV